MVREVSVSYFLSDDEVEEVLAGELEVDEDELESLFVSDFVSEEEPESLDSLDLPFPPLFLE